MCMHACMYVYIFMMYVCMYVGAKEEGKTEGKVYVDDIASAQTPEEVQVIEESKNAVYYAYFNSFCTYIHTYIHTSTC